jgi:hypothetical protein
MGHGLPRTVIPPAWAQAGCCPVCQAAKLSVRQTPGVPDQLACAQCGCAFELEAGSSRLALTEGPPALAAAIGQTARIWLSIAEVRALLQSPPAVSVQSSQPPATAPLTPPSSPTESTAPSAVSTPATPEALPSGLASCTEAELMQRADALLGMGNSPLQIQVALVQSGVAPELVQRVVETMRQLAHDKRQRQLRRTWLLTGLVIACLVFATGAGWALWHQTKGVSAPAAAETPRAPTPTGVAGFLLSLPTSVVQTEPPRAPGAGANLPASQCPDSPNEAAGVFGGRADDWTYKADAGGWIMTAITPQTIHIPAGMLGGYLQFGEGGANMNQVTGPAQIKNVNFIAITCP